jgi:uncharacterized protein YkwD
MKKITSYLIILIAVLLFLFILGCKSNAAPKIEKMNEDFIEQKEDKLKEINLSLLSLHNKERKNHNLEIFSLDGSLCDYAQNHANYMLSKNKLFHSDISNVGAKLVAENIAYGQENEKEVVEAWMNSYFHRMNILNKRYKKIGFGHVNKDGKIYWCAVFTN